ncbi:MAG: dihydrofolate reductase [Prevotellaceae bacterium]|jgi:lactate dehydrogenase-like 2-hydroxyacid dehydrogenase|nr:dihydrofolate reductase [Prevotellaceae bacterium]
MKRVLITTNLPQEGFTELKKYFEVIFPTNEMFSLSEILEKLPGCHALITTYAFKITKEVIDVGENLEIITSYGAGYDNVDFAYARSKGITVVNAPNAVTEPTAEMAFALLCAVARRIPENDRKLRSPEGLNWNLMQNLGTIIYGKTVGIYGMGRIGQAFARRAHACGMKVIYHNRNKLSLDIEERYNASLVSFDDLIKRSDFISIHSPLNDETRYAFNKKVFDKMRPHQIIINTARGPIIEEQTLADALKEGKIKAAALDVFEKEPKILEDLKGLDNVVLTPHTGTSTYETRVQQCVECSENVIRFFKEK